ncbi:MFS general substrate transporter [Amylostereum chailletii]|nr:MFS general substrate transporter [Amylostereum chailletii]
MAIIPVSEVGLEKETRPPSLSVSNDEKQSLSQAEDAEKADDYVIDIEAEKRLIRRLDMRIIPTTMIIYVASFLDRSNIGNAKILNADRNDSLQQTLRITNSQYLDALVIFFVAYSVFEVPSNYMLKNFFPSRWFAFIMFGWGAMTMIQASVTNFGGLAAVRFIMGAFEAGIFPGIIYFLTFWYKPRERALRIALIAASATLGGAFGGAIAYGVGFLDGARGIKGWQWLCLLEGALTCVFAILVWGMLPDYPETVRWLTAPERVLAVQRLKTDSPKGLARISHAETIATLLDWRLFSLFTPTIVSELGFTNLSAQLFTVPPFAAAFAVTVCISWAADRYERWSMPALVCLALSGVLFIVEGAIPPTHLVARYVVLCFTASFAYACNPLLLNYLTVNLHGTSAMTLGVPMNVTLATAGQIIGLFIYKPNEVPAYHTGHFTNAAFMLLGAAIVALLRIIYSRRNKHLTPGAKPWRV